jgi:DNA integrity scanning protein DisA with diadenylate cyclase activity
MNWLTELLQRPPVTAWDIVDITIVSIVVYEVLKLIRGTHAVQMAMGIALLVGMFYASRGFQLETVNWLIRNVVGYVVFAAIVLMQADIRRALGMLGRARLFRLFRRFDRSATDDGGGHAHARGQAYRRNHRHRAVRRTSQLHRKRDTVGCPPHLRPARQHLPGGVPSSRRRGHRAG